MNQKNVPNSALCYHVRLATLEVPKHGSSNRHKSWNIRKWCFLSFSPLFRINCRCGCRSASCCAGASLVCSAPLRNLSEVVGSSETFAEKSWPSLGREHRFGLTVQFKTSRVQFPVATDSFGIFTADYAKQFWADPYILEYKFREWINRSINVTLTFYLRYLLRNKETVRFLSFTP